MKIALVHDWLTNIAGDVRVLIELHNMYPEAPIYCLYYNADIASRYLPNANIISKHLHSFFITKLMSSFFIESFDLRSFDLVISVGSIFSKGIIVRPTTRHINYCHSPSRQLWDLSEEFRHRFFQHFMRIWDRHASTRVDTYIANSINVKNRILKYYKRDSHVVYPPVKLTANESAIAESSDYFLIISRLYKHKNVDIAIKAFNKLNRRLVVIGEGPEFNFLKKIAGPTIEMLGSLTDKQCSDYYKKCLGFIMPQEEDFGITGIEAMLHGKGVLALRRGGALEYLKENVNGIFFDEPHEALLADGVRRFLQTRFNPNEIKSSVTQFSCKNFTSSFYNIINQNLP